MSGNQGNGWDRKTKIIEIEAIAENDGVDMFEQAGVAAE